MLQARLLARAVATYMHAIGPLTHVGHEFNISPLEFACRNSPLGSRPVGVICRLTIIYADHSVFVSCVCVFECFSDSKLPG